MKILLGGALGRMGQEVTAAAAEAQVEIVCGVDVAYTGQPSDYPIVTAFDQATQKADVLIDFSRPSALPELLQLVRKEKMPAVLCTTGYNEAELQMIEEASREIPVFRSANMSLGVNVLRHLVQEAARALGEDFDVEIVERHHRMKADSPSGTALMLYDSVKEAGIRPLWAHRPAPARRSGHPRRARRNHYRRTRGLLLWRRRRTDPDPSCGKTFSLCPGCAAGRRLPDGQACRKVRHAGPDRRNASLTLGGRAVPVVQMALQGGQNLMHYIALAAA